MLVVEDDPRSRKLLEGYLLAEGYLVDGAPDGPTALQMIGQLAKDQETVVRTARQVFPLVDEAHDEPTADLLTQRMQVHEKTTWMLRAMLAGH